ncbi:MAG: DUF2505 domain-containing protein [Pseudomonadota bacterium]
MEVSAVHPYSYPLDQVIAAFMSADFYRSKFTAVGARNIELIDEQRGEDSYVIITEREVPLEGVPGVLKSFLGAWNKIHQSERWERAGDEYFNELKITAAGVPVDLSGSMMLRPGEASGDTTCVNEVHMEVACAVPLVGGKLVEFVAENTQRGLADEHRVIGEYLAQNQSASP